MNGETSESEFWTWSRCKERISALRGRLGFEDTPTLRFLKLKLSLDNGEVFDELKGRRVSEHSKKPIYCILYGYADAVQVPETSVLTSFRHLPGGRMYYSVYAQRVLNPLARFFGENPRRLVEAAEILGGAKLELGDYSVVVRALPLVPITIVLRSATEEFPASVNIYYDSSVSNYLSTEETVMLSELTVKRLRDALKP